MNSLHFCCGLRSRRLLLAALVAAAGSAIAQQPSGGVPARATPEEYAVHVSAGGRTYAASALTSDQVRHLFASDISKSYVVFEVACYPEGGASTDMHPDSFVAYTLDAKDQNHRDIVRPADAMTVAAELGRKNTQRAPTGATQVYTEANIGYETGTDPYSGRRVRGVYGGGGVGVGHEIGTQPPGPRNWPADTEAVERQLADRSLPEGRFDHPIAGYLYFPSALLRKKSKGAYELRYEAGAADSVELMIPARR